MQIRAAQEPKGVDSVGTSDNMRQLMERRASFFPGGVTILTNRLIGA
jgi:hypothetical protein